MSCTEESGYSRICYISRLDEEGIVNAKDSQDDECRKCCWN
jgi:hypothetical protein